MILAAVAVVAALWHPWMKQEGGVAVLNYHSVTADGSWLPWSHRISIAPKMFSRQLEILAKRGCTVLSTSQVVTARRAGTQLGRRPVVIHFDDGYLDNWVAALPLLKRHNFPATVFVSTDFVEPGEELRLTLSDVEIGRAHERAVQWEGYMNWAELREMERSGLIEVECHGTDHGRVPVSEKIVGNLTQQNWRAHAWMQWRHMVGDKSQWYRQAAPLFEPIGAAIPESAAAFAARAWRDGAGETGAEYQDRIYGELCYAKRTVEMALDKRVRFFCWPFNASTPTAHAAALRAGFLATTAGEGENREGEDPTRISRLHVHNRIFPWSNTALEGLVFWANVRLMQGNYYWGLLILPLNIFRRLGEVLTSFYRKG